MPLPQVCSSPFTLLSRYRYPASLQLQLASQTSTSKPLRLAPASVEQSELKRNLSASYIE